jgi:hypothetical protein
MPTRLKSTEISKISIGASVVESDRFFLSKKAARFGAAQFE